MKKRLVIVVIALVVCVAADSVVLLTHYIPIAQEHIHTGKDLRYVVGDLANYSEMDGRLPPAVLRDGQGKPLCSWRFATASLLLGDAVQTGYYGQHAHPDRPWNAPENRRYLDGPYRDYGGSPLTYIDPTRPGNKARFVAVVGPGTAFDDEHPWRLDDLPGNVLLVVETRGCAAHWMEPGGDLDVRTMPHEIGIQGGIGPAGDAREFYIGFADSSVWLVRVNVPFEVLSKFFTVEEARRQDRDSVLGPYAIQVWK